MEKIAIFYGSTSGNTEDVSKEIAKKLSADIYNVEDNPIEKINDYNNLIFGTSTWGDGELQEDWESFLDNLKNSDLSGKTIALFGLGDSSGYPDTFVDGIGIIYNEIKNKECKIIGKVKTDNYDFDESAALISEEFIGLPLDEDNEGEQTTQRIDAWVDELKKEFL